MWDTIHDLTDSLWPLLPQLTIGLRFSTAVIGLGTAAGAVVRRYRRVQRNRRS